jgi:hypothetical protein
MQPDGSLLCLQQPVTNRVQRGGKYFGIDYQNVLHNSRHKTLSIFPTYGNTT